MCFQICTSSRKEEEGIRVPVPDACATCCGRVFQYLKDPFSRVRIAEIMIIFCIVLSIAVLSLASSGLYKLYIDSPTFPISVIMGLTIGGGSLDLLALGAFIWKIIEDANIAKERSKLLDKRDRLDDEIIAIARRATGI